MKKTKFRKLSRVLISISLLAIIAASLISVPVSAAEGDSIVGKWIVKNDYSYVTGSSSHYYNVEGVMYSISSNNSTDVNSYTLNRIEIYGYDVNRVDTQWFRLFGLIDDTQADTQANRVTLTFSGSDVSVNYGTSVLNSISVGSPVYDDIRVFEITSSSDDPGLLAFLLDSCDKVEPPPTLLENILGTFSEVGSWIGTIVSSLVALFWSVETASLTFLGILSVAGLAFSVIMLLFGFVTRFVGFSG